MMHRVSRRLVLSGIGVGALAIVALFLSPGERSAEAAQLSEADAVALAIKYAQMPVPYAHLTSEPTRINGAVMTFGDAQELKDGYRQPPSTQWGRDADRMVWLVFLRGDVTILNQAAPPRPGMPAVPATPPDTYHQMSVLFDATTGELRSTGTRPPDREVAAADSLPTLPIPPTTRSIELPGIVRPAGPWEPMRGPAPREPSPDVPSGPGAPQVPPCP